MTDLFTYTDDKGSAILVRDQTDGTLTVTVLANDVVLGRDPVTELYVRLGTWLGVTQPDGLFKQLADMKAERDELTEERDGQLNQIKQLANQRDELREANQRLQGQLNELPVEDDDDDLGDLQDRVNTLETNHRVTVEKVQDLAEGGIVPPEQAQRAAALQTARSVAQNLTPAGGFGKQGQEARQPDVLSLAHFILTGARDYVTREGEYVERHADHCPQPVHFPEENDD